VPVIVNVAELEFELQGAVTVIVVFPEPLTEVGLKLAVNPAGRPLTVKVTVPVNPPEGVTVTVYVAEPGSLIVREPGVADKLKSPLPTALTTNVTVAEWVRVPLVPVIVRV
jgi:hypothetical protein